MTKREAMIEALAILANSADALSAGGLGMDESDEAKVCDALKVLAAQLERRIQRLLRGTVTPSAAHFPSPR